MRRCGVCKLGIQPTLPRVDALPSDARDVIKPSLPNRQKNQMHPINVELFHLSDRHLYLMDITVSISMPYMTVQARLLLSSFILRLQPVHNLIDLMVSDRGQMIVPSTAQYTREMVNPYHKPCSFMSHEKASQMPKGIPMM